MSAEQPDKTHLPGETTGTGERLAQHLTGAVLAFDLAHEAAQLRTERAWVQGDRNAKTLVKEASFRVVLIALRLGARMPDHTAAGRISLQTLAGHLRVHAGRETLDVPVGGLVTLEHGLPHDVEAVEASTFLLTIAWQGAHD